jgi:branched-chain amino acid transport system permease protein
VFKLEGFFINLLNGLSFGAVLFLLAAGLSLILGLMGVLNLAHGALFLFGAYVGVSLVREGAHFLLAALGGGLSAAFIGFLKERFFLRHLHGYILEQVLISFGFVYILTNLATWIWGTSPQIVTSPIQGSIQIGDLTFPVYRLLMIFVGMGIGLGLYAFDRTRVGAMIRAGMDNRQMTMGLGINIGIIFTLVFCLGAFIAGFAGIIGVPLVGAYPEVAMDALLLALIVVVVGGTGSISGAALASVAVGLLDSFSKALLPGLTYFSVYLALILILLFRPSGLLGRKT